LVRNAAAHAQSVKAVESFLANMFELN